MQLHESSMIASGLSWPECPRWHDSALYFSDLFSARVMRVDDSGSLTVHLDLCDRIGLDGQRVVVGGLGFLPDGRLLVNSILERVTLVYDGQRVEVYGDLRELAIGPINDMVVDAHGRVYVTQLGFNHWAGEQRRDSYIMLLDEGGSARNLDEIGEVAGANGIALSADGALCVTAAVGDKQLVAFDVAADGSLSRRRVFAQLDLSPDGICMDSEGAVWAAQPGGAGAIRVLAGGTVTDKVSIESERGGRSPACMLGGANRTTLFICCGFEVYDFDKSVREGRGSIWSAAVPIGAGKARP
jgi:sugar lactone lactonase YvrE